MVLFIISTCVPAVLIATSAVFAGPWPAIAMLSLTVMVAGLDHFIATVTAPVGEAGGKSADHLSAALAVAHLSLLPLVIWALAGDHLIALEKAFLFIASGIFFGQISNANAHELIHRRQRGLYQLGVWVYSTMLYGHHVSAHLLIHHRYVGTVRDPGTSHLGQSFYAYMRKAWIGGFSAGWAAETRRLKQVQRSWLEHPYLHYLAISGLTLGVAMVLGGFAGALWLFALVGFAQQQLLLCDYVQHYGLERQKCADGRLEPIGDRHSWNAPHWYSSRMMLHAPRHSDHHAHPYRPFPELALPPDAPTLPRSLPVMAVLALCPPAWRHVMDPRALRWQYDRAA